TGDIKISVLVERGDGVRALRAVHQAFALHEPRPGSGLAGKATAAPLPFPRRPAAEAQEAARDLSALTQHRAQMEDIVVSGVLLSTDQGRIPIFDLPAAPGNCSRVFQAVAAAGIVVDMIVHNLTAPGRA